MIRSAEHPLGLPSCLQDAKLREQLEAGNKSLAAAIKIVTVCSAVETVVAVENPDTSLVWQRPFWKRAGGTLLRLDQCFFGTPYRKRTKFFVVHGSSSWLDLSVLCSGRAGRCSFTHAKHQQLVGSQRTSRAQVYPDALARQIAALMHESAELPMLNKFRTQV